jgi:serine-type D-Ala-D-Ala carboxypeptidase/endopeptidase (penicillin-binding protein 4)
MISRLLKRLAAFCLLKFNVIVRSKNMKSTTRFIYSILICLAFNFGLSAQVKPTPMPTPKPVSTPTPTPKPTVSPTPVPTPTPVQTVLDLQNRIRGIVSRPATQRGNIGIKIVSLDTNKVIFENDAEKYFIPASNMKSYTVATALEKLTPDFKFVTSVYSTAKPDVNGVIKGDVSIYGRGDVSISMAFTQLNVLPNQVFSNADYLKVLEPLANKIVASGVKRIEGNLIADDSYFTGNAIPFSWEWDDLQWFSGAEVSALPVLENAIDLFVKQTAIGSPCAYQIFPANSQFQVKNTCTTNASGSKRDLRIEKKLDQNILEISGTMPMDDKGFRGYITVSRPAGLFIDLLRQLLQQKGVTVTGQNKIIGAKDKTMLAVTSMTAPFELTRLESPPLNLIAAKTMKPSQNMFTETILRTLGEQIGDKTDPKLMSDERGLKVVSNFLQSIGIAADAVIQHDGSGLSRHNLITPASNVQLYTYMSRSRFAQVWRDALPIGAVDGTIKSRFINTLAANNVRAKTGTLDQVSSLTGYVTTSSGEKLVFSIIVNGVNEGKLRTATIDEIVVALANFNGKTQ